MECGAVLVVVALVLFVVIVCGRKSEGFVAKDPAAFQRAAFRVFDESQGGVSYTDFKLQLPEANAVSYRDSLAAWKKIQ